MNSEYILPTLHQRAAAAVLGVIGLLIIYRMVRRHKLREEHALLWFVAILATLAVISFNPLLIGITALFGIKVPANALILLTIFFLMLVCIRLSSAVSIQKRQIAKLIIEVSILRSEIARQDIETETRN